MAEQSLSSGATPAGLDDVRGRRASVPGRWRPGSLVAERFRLGRLLGSGAMGEVWSACDLELDEVVALKRLRDQGAADKHLAALFRREVRLARRVSHPNVARVFELVVLPGEGEGRLFLTMEYVCGHTLAELMRRREHLAPPVVVHALRAVSAGLSAVHAAGIVHRDVKPGNVMLGEDGRVVLTDFGVALAVREALSEGGELLGTPAYMAPELLVGAPASAASDLYAFGCVAFELVAGRRVFDASGGLLRLRSDKGSPPEVPEVPEMPGLAALIRACLEPAPGDRPPSAAALEASLARFEVPAFASLLAALPPQPPPEPLTLERERLKLAVLPFEAVGVSADLVGLLCDDFAGELARHKPLHVLAAGAVQKRLSGEGPGPSSWVEMGARLGANLVALGDVRAEGADLGVTLRAISVPGGQTLWRWEGRIALGERLPSMAAAAHGLLSSGHFDEGPPSTQDEPLSVPAGVDTTPSAPPPGPLAQAAPSSAEPPSQAATLLLRRADEPAPDEAKTRAGAGGGGSGRVLELYLRGRALLTSSALVDIESAIACFEDALALAHEDPRVASALTVALTRHLFLSPEAAASVAERAERAAEYALRVAPSMGEAHHARAVVLLHQGLPAEGVRALRQALRCTPGLAAAHQLLGQLLLEAGHEPEGRQRLAAAERLEPGSVEAIWPLYRFEVLAGRGAEAEAQNQALARSEGGGLRSRWYLRLRVAAWRGDREGLARVEGEARAQLGARALLPPFVAYASVALRGEAPGPAYAVLRRSAADSGASARACAFLYQLLAEVACLAGDEDEAARALVLARDASLFDRPWLERCPLLVGVRHRPEYERALEGALGHAEAMHHAYYSEP